MAKDINIHLKTTGAARTKEQLDEVGRHSRQVGEKTAEGQKQGADAVEKTGQRLGGLGRMLSSLKSQVIGFVGAWLGLQGVQRIVGYFIQKLERIQQLQKDIYQQSLSLAEIGQALEIQTGTRGMQQYWTRLAVQIQEAGALASAQVAQQMLVSMDIALQPMGGIKAPQVQQLAKQLAPFVGAAGLGPTEVAKIFEFVAGYTASKATAFGEFMVGLQKGGTAYMAMGGTLEEAISGFAAARSVMANEALAATLVEQIARLSGGGYERPRQAIEKALGVRWSDLSMDQRMRALLRYVGGVPEARRGEVLAKEGFPLELVTQIGKMVSPEAMRTMAATREQVGEATSRMVDDMMQAYLDSMLAQARESTAKISAKEFKAGPAYATMLTRLNEARKAFDVAAAKGQDRWLRDSIEPHIMAIEAFIAELEQLYETAPDDMRPKIKETTDALRERLTREIVSSYEPINILVGMSARKIYQLLADAAKASEEVQNILLHRRRPQPFETTAEPLETPAEPLETPAEPIAMAPSAPGPVTIHNIYDYGMHFYPRVGDDERGERFTQNT
jgi:uncharacterized protein Yka (UPF0111/DUF47 family)